MVNQQNMHKMKNVLTCEDGDHFSHSVVMQLLSSHCYSFCFQTKASRFLLRTRFLPSGLKHTGIPISVFLDDKNYQLNSMTGGLLFLICIL